MEQITKQKAHPVYMYEVEPSGMWGELDAPVKCETFEEALEVSKSGGLYCSISPLCEEAEAELLSMCE